jgi:amidase
MVTLADGSDYGGSIRIPAACCGVIGYKPPHGRNPTDTLDPFSHFGPLARTVEDASLMQNVMSGPGPDAFVALPEPVTLSTARADLVVLRVAYTLDLGYKVIDPEVEAATSEVLDLLRGLGCQVEHVEIGWTDRVCEAYQAHHDAAEAAALGILLPTQRDVLSDYAVQAIERGLSVTGRAVFDTMELRAEMYRAMASVFARADLFVCPTTAIPAPPADHSPLVPEIEIRGRPVPGHHGWVLTYPFNMVGALPVLNVQAGRARSNVPIGVQLVGRPYDDAAVFRAGLAIERARGAWYTDASRQPPPPG